MGLTLAEAKAHAELIKVYDCKICERTITINNSKLALISTLRNNGVCPQCQFVLNWVETHDGQLPTIDDVLS